MIRWLEGNPAGQLLAAIAGGLVLVIVVLGVFWSLPPGASEDPGASADDPLRIDVPRLPESQPIERYAVVTDRPVFNESRQPELEESTSGQENAEEAAETDVEAPELELAGVVITPSLRMVTLRQKQSKESLVAFEGQPLQGDYGSWQVSRIQPREITLASGDGRELQLELQVHKAKIAPPPKPKPAPAEVAAEQQPEAVQGDQPLSRAEEIRQRIAERREELRRAAEAQRSGEKPADDYQATIQSMIGGRTKSNENGNEQ